MSHCGVNYIITSVVTSLLNHNFECSKYLCKVSSFILLIDILKLKCIIFFNIFKFEFASENIITFSAFVSFILSNYIYAQV